MSKVSQVFKLSTIMLLTFSGCTAIIEENLESQTIDIIAPRDGAVSADNVQQFVWDPVEFATEYKFQVAKPEFLMIDKLVVDTITTASKMTLNLPPGMYEWRIKALNSSSETKYFTRRLTVNDTTNLNGSEVILSYPLQNGYVNSVTPTFRWDVVPNAKEYDFKIYEGDFENSNLVTNEISTTNTSVLLTVSLSEKVYSWGVRAENDLSKTLYSSRTFLVDVTSPLTPILSSPLDSAITSTSNIAFSWSSISNGGAPEFDSIYIAADTALNNTVVKAESVSSVFTQTLSPGDYYWAVKRYDKAGNYSWTSELRKLIVQ
jgi:hypothetical protein